MEIVVKGTLEKKYLFKQELYSEVVFIKGQGLRSSSILKSLEGKGFKRHHLRSFSILKSPEGKVLLVLFHTLQLNRL